MTASLYRHLYRPAAPYTANPGAENVEFIEMRISPVYDTHYRADTAIPGTVSPRFAERN